MVNIYGLETTVSHEILKVRPLLGFKDSFSYIGVLRHVHLIVYRQTFAKGFFAAYIFSHRLRNSTACVDHVAKC